MEHDNYVVSQNYYIHGSQFQNCFGHNISQNDKKCRSKIRLHDLQSLILVFTVNVSSLSYDSSLRVILCNCQGDAWLQ